MDILNLKNLLKPRLFHALHGIGEIEQFNIENTWDKQSYSKEVNNAHSNWYMAIYSKKPEYDYEDQGEIVMYLYHEDESLRNQAKYLTDLWFQSVDMLYAHLNTVTEETADVEEFIQTLNTLC